MINVVFAMPIIDSRQKFSRRALLPLNASSFWQIETGYVRAVTIDEEGNLVTLSFWRPGDVIGQFLSWLDSFHIECLTPVEVRRIARDSFRCHAATLSQSYQTQVLLSITHHRRVESRLIHFLDWLAKEFGHPTHQGQFIDIRLTHQDIADAIGTTRVTVTRSLKQLEQDGRVMRFQQRCVLNHNFKTSSDSFLNIPA